MTVCVGAMAQFEGRPIVIGASDRMVTSGDVQFEQEQRKIFTLTQSVAIMVAGDLTIQSDILHRIIARQQNQEVEYPEEPLGVKMVADWFYGELIELTQKRAAQTILQPLGLDVRQLTSPEIAPGLAHDLSKEMLAFQLPTIQAIVMGIDTSGVHIYEVSNFGVACQDWTGFASIGAGAWHANSQLMFGEHVKYKDIAETLMLVYSAKKRAEVAPGVGSTTDIIVIGPSLNEMTNAGTSLMVELEEAYKRVQTEAQRVRADANAKIAKRLEQNSAEANLFGEDRDEVSTDTAGRSSTEHGSKASDRSEETSREKPST